MLARGACGHCPCPLRWNGASGPYPPCALHWHQLPTSLPVSHLNGQARHAALAGLGAIAVLRPVRSLHRRTTHWAPDWSTGLSLSTIRTLPAHFHLERWHLSLHFLDDIWELLIVCLRHVDLHLLRQHGHVHPGCCHDAPEPPPLLAPTGPSAARAAPPFPPTPQA